MGGTGRRARCGWGGPWWLLGALVLGACGEARLVEIEPPGETHFQDDGPAAVAVSGSVRLFPPARSWMEAHGGASPNLDAERVVVEDPLQQAIGEPAPLHAEAPLEAEGTFRVTDVGVAGLVYGLGATLEEAPTLAPLTSVLYDAARAGTRPREDLEDVRVEAVPMAWLLALEEGLGVERLGALAPDAGGLLEAGLLLGQVLDAEGTPVAGARLRVEPAELQERLVYPHGDVEDVGLHATDASGLFLLVHDGADVRTLTLTLEDAPEALPHHGVLAPGRGLLLQLRPPP